MKTDNAEIAFLQHVQEHIDCENIVAQKARPQSKHQINRLCNRITSFIELLKKGIK